MDQGRIGGACSHGNCGYVCPSHVLPLTEPAAIRVAIKSLFQPNAPFRVKPTLDRSVWKWFWEFTKRCRHSPMIEAGHHLKSILDASMSEYRRLMREESLDCEWKESGLLYVLQTGSGMKEFAETTAEAARWGQPIPNIVARAHRHRHAEIRVPTANIYGFCFTTPGWQLKTPYVFRGMGRISTPQLGGALVRQGDEEFFTRHKTWSVKRPRTETPRVEIK